MEELHGADSVRSPPDSGADFAECAVRFVDVEGDRVRVEGDGED